MTESNPRSIRIFVVTSLCACSLSFTGCQSWYSGGYPFNNPSRVPPPGTGTYQLSSGYYNNPGATHGQLSGNPAMPAGRVSGNPGFAASSRNSLDTVQPNVVQPNAVRPASFAQSTPGFSPSSGAVSTAGESHAFPSPASTSISDSPGAGPPSLQWQP